MNGNGSRCHRWTWYWLDGVPLCDAHQRQVLAGRAFGPPPDRPVVVDMATHATRRPRMADVQQGWVLDLGEPYGWAAVTKVELLPPPIDRVPRVRLYFLTDDGARPQHTLPADDPVYPYRRPQQGRGAA